MKEAVKRSALFTPINNPIAPFFSKPMNYITFSHNYITIHQLKSSPLQIMSIKLDNYEKKYGYCRNGEGEGTHYC